jgi:DNA-binding transcriptional LysR family regulator
MQLEALKVFCDVARYRSFSQAAAANHLTQSAASHIVHQLEDRLGVRLIDRSVRPLQLTPTGQVYYDGCKDFVGRYLDLEASIVGGHAPLPATVQVAAFYSVGLGDLGQSAARFQELNPGVEVRVEYLHPDRVYEKVLNGAADFGLVSFPRRSREVSVLSWREEEMVLACPVGHALAGSHVVRSSQLAGEKFVAFDKGLNIRRHVDRFLRQQGVAVRVAAEFDNIDSIKRAVEIGAGVSLLPEPTLRREIEAGTLAAAQLSGCRLMRPLGILCSRQNKPGAAAVRFIDLLRGLGNGAVAAANGDKRKNGRGHRPDRTPAQDGTP